MASKKKTPAELRTIDIFSGKTQEEIAADMDAEDTKQEAKPKRKSQLVGAEFTTNQDGNLVITRNTKHSSVGVAISTEEAKALFKYLQLEFKW